MLIIGVAASTTTSWGGARRLCTSGRSNRCTARADPYTAWRGWRGRFGAFGRRAAGLTGVSPTTVRSWINQGRLGDPPWTAEKLLAIRGAPHSRNRHRPGVHSAHGTAARWVAGCDCDLCTAENRRRVRDHVRAKAQTRLPVETRAALLDALAAGKPFKQALTELQLTHFRVWGLARHDPEWPLRSTAC